MHRGRYCEFAWQRSGRRRSVNRLVEVYDRSTACSRRSSPHLSLGPNDCLVPVSVSRAAARDRLQSLRFWYSLSRDEQRRLAGGDADECRLCAS